jgi:hypothetical protein
MKRYLNLEPVVAAQLTTPADNPFVTDDSRMMDVWFKGPPVRKQLFKKMKKSEQEDLLSNLLARGFLRSGNLLLNPRAILFAEMENELLGGVVTVGYQENNKPLEFKVAGKAFGELLAALADRS